MNQTAAEISPYRRTVRRIAWVCGAAVAVLLAAGCGSGEEAANPPSSAPTTTATAPSATTDTTDTSAAGSVVDAACAGLLESPETVPVQVRPLVEASGLAASRLQDGVLWAHNDSGDSARVFAFGDDGGHLGTFRLAGAEAVDWEDMAVGPAVDEASQPVDDADAVYLADVGDNNGQRQDVSLYRVPEPEVAAGGTGVWRARLDGVERYPFQYPDGPRDAEALFIDRTTDHFYVIEKSLAGGPVGIYRGPLADWDVDHATPPTLERVGTYRAGLGPVAAVTAADMTPAGDALAVRTYGGVRLYERPAGTDILDALDATPCRGPLPAELQGEAVALLPDASAYLTLPEGAAPTLAVWRR